jgi:small-conductance mechanosensitive channel
MSILTFGPASRIKALMRYLPSVFIAALAFASISPAQEPGNAPEQLAAPARPRPAAPPLSRPRADSPEQAGREQLYKYLDDIASRAEAERHSNVASITARAEAQQRQQEVRARILKLIGGLPERTPLEPRITGSSPTSPSPPCSTCPTCHKPRVPHS